MTEWSHDRIERLVQLYKNRPELWNPQDNNYHVKNMKVDAWRSIAAEMESTVETVKSKVSSLLSSYRREVGKVKKSIAAGNGKDGIYKSSWFAYKFFSFMTDRYKSLNLEFPENGSYKFYNWMEDDSADDSMPFEPTASDMVKVEFHGEDMPRKPILQPASQSPPYKRRKPEEEATYIPCIQPPLQPTAQSPPYKRRKPEEEATYVPCLQSYQDESTVYCEYLACKLRKFDERERVVLMQQINNLMFEAEMRRLDVKDGLQQEEIDATQEEMDATQEENDVKNEGVMVSPNEISSDPVT